MKTSEICYRRGFLFELPWGKTQIRTYKYMDHRIYRRFFCDRADQSVIVSENPHIGITEHPEENGVYAVLINYSGETQVCRFYVQNGCWLLRVDYGAIEQLPPYECGSHLFNDAIK